MCDSPIRIVNPKKYFRVNGGQKLYIDVPCGDCVSCRKLRQNEWRLRISEECKQWFPRGGVLFDTLTYSNENLPTLSHFFNVPTELDYSCFNRKDIQNFLKRLRVNMERQYKIDVEGKLRYFIVSEYGSEKYTTRPHYHCLFYFDNSIDPFKLSRCIGESWGLGLTDGLPFKSRGYVLKHNLFKSNDSISRCVQYVSKYVSKDFMFSSVVGRRLKEIKKFLYNNKDMTIEDWEEFKKIREYVGLFNAQSKKFGYGLFDALTAEKAIKENCIKIKDEHGLPIVFPLFAFIRRKLFYDVNRDEKKNVSWIPNEFYYQYQKNKVVYDLKRCEERFENLGLSKGLAFDYLFKVNRFPFFKEVNTLSDVYELIDAGNVNFMEFGVLRNYASIDQGFIGVKGFASQDFGSKKDGYKRAKIEIVNSFEDSLYFDWFVPLEKIPICECSEVDFVISEKNKIEYNRKMAVARLKERLFKIHK